jgi:hypothetical protein
MDGRRAIEQAHGYPDLDQILDDGEHDHDDE